MILSAIAESLPLVVLQQAANLKVPAILFVLLLIWRLWKFTISPKLHPERAQELPYWIPFIGHTFSFFMDAPAVVDAGVRMSGDSKKPFAIQLLGIKNYFVIRPHDITQAYRNMTTLSFDRFLDDYVCCFGVKKEDVPAMNEKCIHLDRNQPETSAYPSEGCNMKEFLQWTYKRQLAIDKNPEFWGVFFDEVAETMKFSNLQKHSLSGSRDVINIQLRDFLSHTLSTPVTKMLFGSKLLEIDPDMPTHVHGFIDGLWKLVYQYPRWARKDVAKDHEATLASLERFAKEFDPETSDASWLIRTVIHGQAQSKMQAESNAAMLSVLFLATLANVHATGYWLLCYILTDPDLKAAIMDEIAPAFNDGVMDAYHIAEMCPLLSSAFHEVLRLHITSNTIRYIEHDTIIEDTKLASGNQLMIPLRQLNHSDSIWGGDHNRFDPARFVKNKNLSSHTAFRPFGGGINLCPGKAFATRQVMSFVSYFLYTYDISLPTRNGKPQPLPSNQHETLAFGVAVPKEGTDLQLELKPSRNVPLREVKIHMVSNEAP